MEDTFHGRDIITSVMEQENLYVCTRQDLEIGISLLEDEAPSEGELHPLGVDVNDISRTKCSSDETCL